MMTMASPLGTGNGANKHLPVPAPCPACCLGNAPLSATSEKYRSQEREDNRLDLPKSPVRRAEEGESIEQLYAQQEKLNHDLKDGSENAAAKERLEAIEAEIKKREEAKEKQRLNENSSE